MGLVALGGDAIFVSAIVFAAALALLNGWRGTVLMRCGGVRGARKAFVLGLSMLILAALAVYLRPL